MNATIDTIPAGFKQTEVGLIPKDWNVQELGEIGALTTGSGLLKGEILSSGAIPAIPYTSLYTDFSEILNYDSIKWFIDDASKTHLVDEPCVLIASSSNMEINTGKASALTKSIPVAVGREVIILKSNCDCVYISYLLSTELYRKRTLALARGTTIKHVYTATFYKYPIAIPAKSEQEAIATALSDTDAWIESLEELVAKKRHLKQAAMQQLLTGKKRLPGFDGEWEVKQFGEIAKLRGQRTNPRHGETPTFCIELEHIEQGTGQLIGHTLTTKESSLKSAFSKEDVLFGKLRAYLRKYWIADRDGVCSTEIWVLIAKAGVVTPTFLYQLVKTDSFIEVASTAYGTHMPRSDWDIIRKYEVRLPCLIEQTAIAEVLSDMDTEITAIEAKLTKARQIKQGMMQELLTGRIRLVEPATQVATAEKSAKKSRNVAKRAVARGH